MPVPLGHSDIWPLTILSFWLPPPLLSSKENTDQIATFGAYPSDFNVFVKAMNYCNPLPQKRRIFGPYSSIVQFLFLCSFNHLMTPHNKEFVSKYPRKVHFYQPPILNLTWHIFIAKLQNF